MTICQQTQEAIFTQLDVASTPVPQSRIPGASSYPDTLRLHLGACPMCQRYEAELQLLLSSLQEKSDLQVSALAEPPEGLADRVWSRLLAETDLGQLEEASVTTTPVKVQRLRRAIWWRQPVAPMAAAAVLLVMVGWSFTALDGPLSLLNPNSPYLSADYEVDGQKLIYDNADRILDPAWIGEEDSTTQESSVHEQRKATAKLASGQTESSSIASDADGDPLSSWVGF
jgi:hypothetical protein